MRTDMEKRIGGVEFVVASIAMTAVIGLVIASIYYAPIWPHKSRALLFYALYPSITAVTFGLGGLLLWKGWDFRYAMQPALLGYGIMGIVFSLAPLVELYLL